MNPFDILIIYLACGAPVGVYYFVNNRYEQDRRFLKALFITLVWFWPAARLLQKYVTKELPASGSSKKDSLKDEEILETRKRLEAVFAADTSGASLFEVREILDRYIGLTDAVQDQTHAGEGSSQFFEAAGSRNPALAAKCHYRRNRRLLFFHQTLAGQDFLKTVSGHVSRFPNDAEIESSALKLAGLLRDQKMEKNLKLLFGAKPQSRGENGVRTPEKELWKTDLQPQPPTAGNALRLSLNTGDAKISLPIKD